MPHLMPIIYPKELLPYPTYKLIELSSVSTSILVRHIDRLSDDEVIIDGDGNILPCKICHPTSRMVNLSMNLLGHYKLEHNLIKLSTVAKDDGFTKEWMPNCPGMRPLNPIHFSLDTKRAFWGLELSIFTNISFKDTLSNAEIIATSFVVHAPTRCNFWHFTIEWMIDNENIRDLELSKNKKEDLSRRIGQIARSRILNYASVNFADREGIEETLFMN